MRALHLLSVLICLQSDSRTATQTAALTFVKVRLLMWIYEHTHFGTDVDSSAAWLPVIAKHHNQASQHLADRSVLLLKQ
jgi:hypothetical protein